MLKERRFAAEQIASALFDAETAIDEALTKTAALAGAIPAFRKQAGASALIAQDAMERASHAVVALAEARRAVVETHKELTVAKSQIGLGAVTMIDTGGGVKPPPTIDDERVAARASLHAVAAA